MSNQAAETSLSYSTLLAYAVGLDAPDILWGPSYSNGTRIWLRRNGRWNAFLINDLLGTPATQPVSLASPFIASGGLSGGWPVTKTTAGASGDLSLLVKFPSAQQITPAVGVSFPVGVTSASGTNSPYTTTDTATLLNTSGVNGIQCVKNTGAAVARVGGSDVLAGSKGYSLAAAEVADFGVPTLLYAISDAVGVATTLEFC